MLLCLTSSVQTKCAEYAFSVHFTDKSPTLAITDATQYLSLRAIARRENFQIPIDSTDLPLAKRYLDSVLLIPGSRIHSVSKWLNLCVVLVNDSSAIRALLNKPFVRSITLIGYYPDGLQRHKSNKKNTDQRSTAAKSTADAVYYGNTWAQTTMVSGQVLHNAGYKGNNKWIAVFDGGFIGADKHTVFDSLRASGRLVDTYNFTLDTNYVFSYDTHGTRALSAIAGYVPDTFVGSAPLASYALYVTEDSRSEQPIEMYNMLSATERADSAGIDVISCSLGYNEFDNPADNFNFATDFDGQTTIATMAANMATTKGILFVTSAGNEGLSAWQKILTPGDSDSALTVGSVDITGSNATTSGYGPNADGQVKPDVCGLGQPAAVVNGTSYTMENGTSFSTPQIAGWAACLMQLAPTAPPSQIKNAIVRCASSYSSPGIQLGYGIPNFGCVGTYLGLDDTMPDVLNDTLVIENPFTEYLHIRTVLSKSQQITFQIIDITGKSYKHINIDFDSGYNNVRVEAWELPKGVYLLKATGNAINYVWKIVKW